MALEVILFKIIIGITFLFISLLAVVVYLFIEQEHKIEHHLPIKKAGVKPAAFFIQNGCRLIER